VQVEKTVAVTETVQTTRTLEKTIQALVDDAAPPPTEPDSQDSGNGPASPSGSDCPSSAPIKGNASSMIYHVPGGEFYDRTVPEQCFSSESDAVAAGYRASKR